MDATALTIATPRSTALPNRWRSTRLTGTRALKAGMPTAAAEIGAKTPSFGRAMEIAPRLDGEGLRRLVKSRERGHGCFWTVVLVIITFVVTATVQRCDSTVNGSAWNSPNPVSDDESGDFARRMGCSGRRG